MSAKSQFKVRSSEQFSAVQLLSDVPGTWQAARPTGGWMWLPWQRRGNSRGCCFLCIASAVSVQSNCFWKRLSILQVPSIDISVYSKDPNWLLPLFTITKIIHILLTQVEAMRCWIPLKIILLSKRAFITIWRFTLHPPVSDNVSVSFSGTRWAFCPFTWAPKSQNFTFNNIRLFPSV